MCVMKPVKAPARTFGAPQWTYGKALNGHSLAPFNEVADVRAHEPSTLTKESRPVQAHKATIVPTPNVAPGSTRDVMDGNYAPKSKATAKQAFLTPLGPVTLLSPPEPDLGKMPTASTLDFLKYEYKGTRLQPLPRKYNGI